MAAEYQMKKVTGHLTCSTCYELYKKPKYPCYHSYCEECLVELVEESNITCPECRHRLYRLRLQSLYDLCYTKTSVDPSGEVKQSVPNHFFINRSLDSEVALKRKVERGEEAKCDQCVREDPVEVLCLDCGIFLCNYCYGHHKYSKDYQDHNMMPLNDLRSKKEEVAIKPKDKYTLCQEHELELNFYCEACDQLVCHYCIIKDHLKHDYDTVKEMATKHRKNLDKIMEPVEKMIERLSVACKKVSDTKDKIGAQANDIGKEIDMYYEELYRQLQQQRDELKKELHEISRQRKKEVTLQLEQIEHTQAQLESILNAAMKSGSYQETLLMKKQLVNDVKRISDSYNRLDTQPVQSATMEFIPVKEYKKSMPQFGHLMDGLYPLKSKVDYPQWSIEGKIINIKLVTKDHSNHLCHKGDNEVVIQTQSSRGDVTSALVKDNKDGIYSASFIPNQAGEVKLSVIINGQQVKGSPFNVKVHGKYNTLDKPSKVVNEGGRMGTPRGIAFSRDGMWAVTDDTSHCVWIFDREDQLVRKFGSKGTDNGKFDCPLEVAFDSDDNLYVIDCKNHRVQKFTINGAYLLHFDLHARSFPVGIWVHSDRVYVAGLDSEYISVFKLNGQLSHTIQPHCECVIYPEHIAFNNNHQLLVTIDKYVLKLTLDGNFVGHGTRCTRCTCSQEVLRIQSGRCTSNCSQEVLGNPGGIAIDKYGCIIVTENNNNRVSIFDKDGIFMHSFGSSGSGNGQFSSPHQVAISPIGDIYICDTGNNRIQIFSS